ncbi:MAG: caspase family protein [Myxococcota bacterium]
MTAARVAALLLVLAGLGGGVARADALVPGETWSLVSGVLEWRDRDLPPFSKVHRKDKELDDTLGAIGVPAAQRTLLLDAAATSDGILAALRQAVRKAPKGSTLIFYFAGHGISDAAGGGIVFASSDVSSKRPKETGLALADLAPILQDFKGKRLILMADCCYSGGLVAVGQALAAAGLRVAVLTSAEASNVSTGNWTFTQTVIDALAGRAIEDRNDDGQVTLGELAVEVADAMKYREQQRAAWAALGVDGALVVARTRPEPEPLAAGRGELGRRRYVLVNTPPGSQRVARILGARKDGSLRVAYYDYSDESDDWVAPSATQPIEFPTWGVGTTLTVLWKQQPFEAHVTAVEDGFMRITYPGWSASWDEWITAARVPHPPGSDAQAAHAVRASVEWKGDWYDAIVLGKKGSLVCIHYVGWADSWDECVPPARVKAL